MKRSQLLELLNKPSIIDIEGFMMVATLTEVSRIYNPEANIKYIDITFRQVLTSDDLEGVQDDRNI